MLTKEQKEIVLKEMQMQYFADMQTAFYQQYNVFELTKKACAMRLKHRLHIHQLIITMIDTEMKEWEWQQQMRYESPLRLYLPMSTHIDRLQLEFVNNMEIILITKFINDYLRKLFKVLVRQKPLSLVVYEGDLSDLKRKGIYRQGEWLNISKNDQK